MGGRRESHSIWLCQASSFALEHLGPAAGLRGRECSMHLFAVVFAASEMGAACATLSSAAVEGATWMDPLSTVDKQINVDDIGLCET